MGQGHKEMAKVKFNESIDKILGIPEDKIFYKTPDGSILIINDDLLSVDYINRDSIDLIVTSPPYNVDIEYEGYRDNIPYEKYLEFTEKWLRVAYKLLKPDGRICLNIPLDKSRGRTGEGFQSVYVDVVSIAKFSPRSALGTANIVIEPGLMTLSKSIVVLLVSFNSSLS